MKARSFRVMDDVQYAVLREDIKGIISGDFTSEEIQQENSTARNRKEAFEKLLSLFPAVDVEKSAGNMKRLVGISVIFIVDEPFGNAEKEV
jgi:hypothetical protein